MTKLQRLLEGAAPGIEELRAAYRGTLLGVAAGNGLGLHVEFWSRAQIAGAFPNGVLDIPERERRAAWDDDLAQTVVLAEALVEQGALAPEDVARRLVAWAQENGRGIGILTTAVVNRLAAGEPAADAARREWEASGRTSAGNGAVMRCAPVALRWRSEPDALVDQARIAAAVTHYDPRCVWSTVAVVIGIAASAHGRVPTARDVAEAVAELDGHAGVVEAARACDDLTLDDMELDDPAARGYTLKAMQVGLWCLTTEMGTEAALSAIVSAGGDTDTNGAVAGAVLGARRGEDALPVRWLDNIAGADRLRELAEALLARSASPA